ncbi:uncharacterized protein Nmag_1939 [Natrialba magadii ATCC 43099]|uniref:Uncharacterized protein n=1 Tax=Natrialba magadii (strain ATCC 43099 / DSM 3394 / CCM 3739 / CIP 104546 / IAM 13178 / JCM 8861 / NBRC 102185 / NCIMB 2190 / MS3) TaxID=547559 RepID=D3SVA2_NATMM|nr:hypothetical protein [Natrialba magadii]ADD05510.1 uncharacterized protein Nmag_1939 [Natrialba magadii ATCC 43099]ELY29527.1 hypothetical protein C500_10698 [Natrialba magadii ATCC 43099]
MALQRILSGDPSKTSKLYLAIGVLSLVKAIAVRDDKNRFRQELMDAGLFIGVGIALRKYSQLKAEKRSEIESQVPDWALDAAESAAASQAVRSAAKRGLRSRSQPEPEPEPGIRDRARGLLSSW